MARSLRTHAFSLPAPAVRLTADTVIHARAPTLAVLVRAEEQQPGGGGGSKGVGAAPAFPSYAGAAARNTALPPPRRPSLDGKARRACALRCLRAR